MYGLYCEAVSDCDDDRKWFARTLIWLSVFVSSQSETFYVQWAYQIVGIFSECYGILHPPQRILESETASFAFLKTYTPCDCNVPAFDMSVHCHIRFLMINK